MFNIRAGSKVHPTAGIFGLKSKPGDISGSTFTNANDATADNMMIEDMMREPGIPIGSIVDRSIDRSYYDVSGRTNYNDVSKRSTAMLHGMWTDKSVDVTREDNEVLDRKVDLSVFDMKPNVVN